MNKICFCFHSLKNEITVCRTFPPTIGGMNPLIKSTDLSSRSQPINLTPWSNWTIKFSLSILCGEGDRSLEKVGRSLASLHTRPPTAIGTTTTRQMRQEQVRTDRQTDRESHSGVERVLALVHRFNIVGCVLTRKGRYKSFHDRT